MICPECKYDNPEYNRFCGMCGMRLAEPVATPPAETATLQEPSQSAEMELPVTADAASAGSPLREPEAGTAAPLPAPQEPLSRAPEPFVFHHEVSRSSRNVSGPSFLGLGSDDDSTGYLLEEEPRPSHMRRNMALLALLLVAVLGFLEWRASRPGGPRGPMELLHLRLPGKDAKSADQQTATAHPPAENATPELVAEPVQSGAQATPSPTAEPTQAAAAPSPSPSPTAEASPSQNAEVAAATETAEAKGDTSDSNSEPVETARNVTPPAAEEGSIPQSEGTEAAPPRETPKRTVRDETARAGQAELQQGIAAGPSEAGRMWLWKSTAKGNPTAPVLLAQMYLDGNGVPRNCEQALLLLQTASRKNNPRARSKLASLYANGQCVQQDRVQAYRWLSAALEANPGSEWLDENRESLWNQMTPGERQKARPFR